MKRFILVLMLVFGALSASAQTRVYLSSTNGIYEIQSLRIGGQIFTNLAGLGLTNDQGILKVVGGGSGTGNADTNSPNGWSQKQTFAGGIDAPGTNTLGVIHVTAIESDTPIDQSIGGTGGTDAETSRAALGLAYDDDVAVFRLVLKQIALALLADGDMPYINSSGVATNTPSLAYGRSLLNTLDGAAARALLDAVYRGGDTMSGPLLVPYIAIVAGQTNVGSNQVATVRAVAEVEQRVSVGGYISSVTNDFEVVGGKLLVTNTLGDGPLLRSSAAGTNSTLDGVSDVVITNPTMGKKMAGYGRDYLAYDGTNWVNAPVKQYGYGIPDEYEEIWINFPSVTTQSPFSANAVNGGSQSAGSNWENGRMGRHRIFAPNAPTFWSGAFLATGSLPVTNDWCMRFELLFPQTNGVVQLVGYSDKYGLTNSPGTTLMLSVTNGLMRFVGMMASNVTLGSGSYVINTNEWHNIYFYTTNQVAAVEVLTNGAVAFQSSINSVNVPGGGVVTAGLGVQALVTPNGTASITNGQLILATKRIGMIYRGYK